jgi:hypothetical protein
MSDRTEQSNGEVMGRSQGYLQTAGVASCMAEWGVGRQG